MDYHLRLLLACRLMIPTKIIIPREYTNLPPTLFSMLMPRHRVFQILKL